MFALYKENKISRRHLFSSIKTRSRKQVNSHFNKIKYYLEKIFKRTDNHHSEKKKKFLQQLESLRPTQTKRENSIMFHDDITQKKLQIPLPILEKIVSIQKFHKEKSGAIKIPMRIDESILRTIAEEKLFYEIIKKQVEEDKQ